MKKNASALPYLSENLAFISLLKIPVALEQIAVSGGSSAAAADNTPAVERK